MFQNLGGILSSVNQQSRPPTSEATATVRVTGGNATQPADAATSQNPAMPAGFAELLGSIAMMNMGNVKVKIYILYFLFSCEILLLLVQGFNNLLRNVIAHNLSN